MNHSIKTALLFGLSILLLPSCSDLIKEEEKEAEPTNITIIPPSASESSTTTTASDTNTSSALAAGNGMYLLTPEQLSKTFFTSLDHKRGWTDNFDRFHDAILELLSIPLGGVDFRSVSIRGRLPKVQTQLVIRMLAWQTAAFIIWREGTPTHPDPKTIFLHCNINEDRPYRAQDEDWGPEWVTRTREGEGRWQLQLEEIYWRLLSRPPTQAEIDLIKASYLQALSQYDDWIAGAWIPVLYALLSSTEFWNL